MAPLGIDLPLKPSLALLLRFEAPAQLIRTLVCSDDVEARQTSDGTVLVPVEYEGEAEQDLARTADRTLRQLRNTFAVEAEDLRLVDIRVGVRPMPIDGMPLIGPVPLLAGVYLTVMHSGVTLAPVAGRLVAEELINKTSMEELSGLGPLRDRFEPADVFRPKT